ncbi:MAG: hypothetical protein RMK20_07505 [Verrucomicrobiales bacterium]|nr:hypothetical protein [Verrucomicrobiales bacterium]
MTDWETAWRLFNGQDARRGFNIRKKAGAAPLQLHPEFERFRNTRKRQLYDSLGRPADMVWERDPTEAAKSVQDWHAGAFSRGGAVLTLPGKQNLDVYKPPKIAGGF